MNTIKLSRKALAASLKLPVAQHYIERLNREEADFKTVTQYAIDAGREPSISRSDWLFTRACGRRPDVRYVDNVRMSKEQFFALQSLINDGGSIWCGIEHIKDGATAVLCKHGTSWIVVYEDGTSNKGEQFMLRYTWPRILKRCNPAPLPVFETGSCGGFKLNRNG